MQMQMQVSLARMRQAGLAVLGPGRFALCKNKTTNRRKAHYHHPPGLSLTPLAFLLPSLPFVVVYSQAWARLFILGNWGGGMCARGNLGFFSLFLFALHSTPHRQAVAGRKSLQNNDISPTGFGKRGGGLSRLPCVTQNWPRR